MIAQWPRVETKDDGFRLVRQIRDSLRRCYEHVAELQKAKLGDPVNLQHMDVQSEHQVMVELQLAGLKR